ncbi:DUF547 domain-containing protein [Photobacterium alginatilyticum]|uniref:DUF547 domain-containing protein n=1 Tax=Photobacterium alginatilyticum TaxID=1775171 RepID=A0ABW9YHY5_9GAMM|nr:DUF547 domain-containing protein [Photobacterium alginatilyticum]NBI53427.1 DUF547 domain-containing protein [Photobacterium alginatilyticum]
MRTIFTLFLLLVSATGCAAPRADLWSYWQQSNETNTATIDHSLWQQTLDSYLVAQPKQTLFRYRAVSSSDKYNLDRYIRKLTATDPRRYSKDEQFAYWVNLYNALTVQLILDNYPLKSITKLGGLFSFGPWDEKLVTINGNNLSLNDIEHRILRPIWKDPRIHYVVNCASLGCPDLQPTAFTASNSEKLLEQSANRFINSAKGVRVSDDNVRLSSIYDWYSVDFGSTSSLQKHLNRYRQGQPVQLNKVSYDYDWALNEAR